mmetsp:Transcript_17951/g.52052  ORF Transcript_17951/g.52052 Transcript_17951/m.52052 type:complete len:84 (-) Transcript_17951:479-730(-)
MRIFFRLSFENIAGRSVIEQYCAGFDSHLRTAEPNIFGSGFSPTVPLEDQTLLGFEVIHAPLDHATLHYSSCTYMTKMLSFGH